MIEQWSNWVWGNGLLVLLLGTGGYLTIRTRFFPIRCVRSIFRSTVGSLLRQPKQTQRSAGTMTQFQTCSTALAAAMGTGNIIGVAAALQIGGAGAVFWMWISALLGMLLTYGENVLAMQYCRLDARGERIGGPMAYLAYGLRAKPLAVVYAVFCIAASLGMGNMTQSNAIAGACLQAAGVPVWVTGLAVAGILTVVIFGGAKRIGYVTQWLMPVLSLGYMLAALLVICKNGAALPGALREIVLGAFGMRAVGGGISGAAIRRCMIIGLQRGVFSNEAGLGSSALVHSHADSKDAAAQGMWSMVEVGFDTIVCCTLTALALLTAGGSEGGTCMDWIRFFAGFRHCFAACFNRDDWLVCILHADWMELLWGAGSAVSGRFQRHYAVSGWLLCSCIARRCYANADHLGAFGSLQWVNGNSQFNWTFTIVRANSKKFNGLGKKK